MKHCERKYYSVINESEAICRLQADCFVVPPRNGGSISYESCYRGKIEITRDKKGKVTSRKIIR